MIKAIYDKFTDSSVECIKMCFIQNFMGYFKKKCTRLENERQFYYNKTKPANLLASILNILITLYCVHACVRMYMFLCIQNANLQ